MALDEFCYQNVDYTQQAQNRDQQLALGYSVRKIRENSLIDEWKSTSLEGICCMNLM